MYICVYVILLIKNQISYLSDVSDVDKLVPVTSSARRRNGNFTERKHTFDVFRCFKTQLISFVCVCFSH